MADIDRGKYCVEALANTILDSSEELGRPLGPMKIQKLMYLMHGYYLALTGAPLVDEFFEAWQYGPVVPTIYHEFKQFAGSDIKKGYRASKLKSRPDIGSPSFEEPRIPSGDFEFQKVSKFVFDTYGDKTAIYLSDLTHKVGSPWHQVRLKVPGMRNADIPNDTIKEYFKQFV